MGAHHMQILSGCPPAIYWLGSYLWDFATHVLVCVCAMAVFAAYQDEAFAGSVQQAGGTFLLLVAYGAAVVPLAYCYSFAFGSASAAQVSCALGRWCVQSCMCVCVYAFELAATLSHNIVCVLSFHAVQWLIDPTILDASEQQCQIRFPIEKVYDSATDRASSN